MIALFRGTFQPPGSGGMGPGMSGWEYHMGWLSIIMIGLFWIAVIVAILFFIRWLMASKRRGDHGVKPAVSALEILKIRYAKGEINRVEFEEKKKDLGYQ